VTPLRLIRLAHTAIWAFFGGCILAIPALALAGHLRSATVCAAFVAMEVLVLAFNAWRCPLTTAASRYTRDRRDNFDIYLPEWLARHNKLIFGALYAASLLILLCKWRAAASAAT